MTAQSRTPEILNLLALNIRDAAEIARCLVGAQGLILHIGAEMEWARERLAGSGLALANKPMRLPEAVEEAHLPRGLRVLPRPTDAPTDLVNIGLYVAGKSGSVAAMLEIRQVPAGWDTRDHLRGLDHVRALLQGQVDALVGGPAIVAGTMQRLVTLLRDLDDNVVSHGFSGLLNALTGKTPSRVEVMSMRICGLAATHPTREDAQEVVLSDVAVDLLEQAGLGRSADMQQFEQPAEAGMPDMVVPVPQNLAPFARARIVEHDYDVAEEEETGRLWFRQTGSKDIWSQLANGFSDGWTEIAAEILGQSDDITSEFAQMHLIRRRDLPTDEIAEAYELDGTIWWLRSDEAGTEARFEGGDWQSCSIDPDIAVKKRAFAALSQLDPNIADRLGDAVHDWAHRMAHAVQVVPYMAIAAE